MVEKQGKVSGKPQHTMGGLARWRHYLAWTNICYFRAVARVENVWKPPPRQYAGTLGAI